MSAKRKREALGLTSAVEGKTRSKSFVTFRNGHLQLDVRGYLRSEEGKKSIAKVIGLSPEMPNKSRKPSDEQGIPDGTCA